MRPTFSLLTAAIVSTMALLLREDEVQSLLDMDTVMEAVEAATRELGEGAAQNQPRRRVYPPGGILNVMFASVPSAGYSGLKSYSVGGGKARFLVVLYDLEGRLQALIEADWMGAYRTGAATGVAVRALAPRQTRKVAIIGTGHQARTQAMAVTRAIQIEELRVFGRDAERRQRFADSVATDWGRRPVVASSAEEAVRDADVVITITTAGEPVFDAGWVRQGALVCGCGSNIPTRAEIPPQLVASADLIVADQVEAAQLESGDLITAGVDWSRVVGLGEVLAGKAAGRKSDDQTVLFESHGLALWDIAAGAEVLAAARKRGIGTEVPLFG
jgi:ornithine cyclodeaminase